MKPWVINTVVTIAACLVMLVGIEFALRLFGDDVLALGNQAVFFAFDPKLGWSNLPGAEGTFTRADYQIHVQINADGRRDRPSLPPSTVARRVAVLGDSFVWGVGAEYGQRFTEVMERDLPQLDAVNWGVSGYGTTQEYLQLDRVLAEKPDYVVVAFCLSNDVMETVSPFRTGYNKPFVKRGPEGEAEITGYPLLNAKKIGRTLVGEDSPIRLLALYRMLADKIKGPSPAMKAPRFHTDFSIEDSTIYQPDDRLNADQLRQKREALDLDADVLAMMQEKVRAQLGPGRFLVAFVPTKFELPSSTHAPMELGDQLKARLVARGVAVLDPRKDFSEADFWKHDGHWDPAGHVKFAHELEGVLGDKLPPAHAL